MASIITIILFFIYLWGLGFTATYFVKRLENFWEQQLLNLGIGLGIFPILAVLLNFLHIPLDWKIFLVLSLIFPIYILFKRAQKKTLRISQSAFRLTKSNLVILAVIMITAVSLYMYASGAFSYPYLEDEDPWGHSIGAKYVAMEKNAYDPPLVNARAEIDPVLSYIDPYPPAYNILMGILHQTSENLNWTLKFFNALIISLGFIFFFLFAKHLIGSGYKALFATFVLAAIPGYLSHFIWAHALIITIFFPTLYAFDRLRDSKINDGESVSVGRYQGIWTIIALLLVASLWVTQNLSQPVKMSTMLFIFIVVASILYQKIFWKGLIALAGGILTSFLWWGVMIKKYTLQGFMTYFGGGAIVGGEEVSRGAPSFTSKFSSIIYSLTSPGGTASRSYTFSDFFYAQGQNMINNPVGIGVVVSILALIGVVYVIWKYKSSLVTEKNFWRCLVISWLIFTFWGVNGMTFPISVAKGAFRVWMLLAIPVSLISVEGLTFLKSFSKLKSIRVVIVIIILIGVLMTSAQQKYELNTAVWPTSGSFTGMPAQAGFEYGAWFNTLEPNTKVFLFSPRDKVTIGFGAFSCDWCQEIIDFRRDILSHNAEELYTFLKANGYQFLVISGPMDYRYLNKQYGEETEGLINQKYQEILNSGLFTPVHQVENWMLVLAVN
jgi:hypothetical protein